MSKTEGQIVNSFSNILLRHLIWQFSSLPKWREVSVGPFKWLSSLPAIFYSFPLACDPKLRSDTHLLDRDTNVSCTFTAKDAYVFPMDLASLIKSSRTSLGWDQAELARHVGVTPRTVSRWESGKSRPRGVAVQKLIATFGTKAKEWLVEATSASVQKGKAAGVVGPVQTLSPRLPLPELTPENFELFYRDYLSGLYPSAVVSRIGSQGHTQDGIDLLVEFPDGSRWTFQCKRRKNFGKAKVAEAVKAHLVPANRMHLVLSRVATPEARKEMAKYAGWQLLDVEDISARVRTLPPDRAAQLIDTYFGGYWRASFLGVPAPGPWLTTADFFRPLEGIERTFTHSWTLVGRERELKELIQDINTLNNRVIVLSSPGGSGKSRLIKEIATQLASEQPMLSVRFASQGFVIVPSDLDSLPTGRTVVFIDDVHDRNDFRVLLQTAASFRENLQLLVTTRPYHQQRVQSESGVFGFNPKIYNLQPLRLEEHIEIATEILTSLGGNASFARSIAELTKDSPLATAIGASLVAKHALNPQLLVNEEDFRRELMSHFQDVLLGSIPGQRDEELLKELLQLVALLQPITTDSTEQQEILSTILGKPSDAIVRLLNALRDGQILLQRGTTLRIVPDLLADYIVENECVDIRTGKATGYADRILNVITSDQAFNVRTADLAEHLLINLAKLDWRLSAASALAQSLLANIWITLGIRFRSADATTQRQLILTVGTVAYFQPRQVLYLAKLAMDDPLADSYKADANSVPTSVTEQSMNLALAILLRNAAYGAASDFDTLDEICDRLWQLGRCDPRQLNQTPQHPIRMLNEIVSVAPGKPIEFSEHVLAHTLTWLSQANDKDTYSAFDVIDALLATEGHETQGSRTEIKFSPYTILPDAVAPLRRQIVEAAAREISSPSIRRALRAAASLETAMREPMGMFGRTISDEERSGWKPQIGHVLSRIRQEITESRIDAYVRVRLLQGVRWHARYGKDPDLKGAARDISSELRRSVEFKFSQALINPWDDDTGEHDDADFDSNPRTAQLRGLVDKTCAEMSLDSVTALLLDRLSILRQAKGLLSADPGQFVGYLVEAQPLIGIALAESTLESPDGPASTVFNVSIAALAFSDPAKALGFAHRALQLNRPDFDRQVSFAYGWGLGISRYLSEAEITLIEGFAEHEDVDVRINASRAILQIHKQDPARAFALVLAFRIQDSERVADEILSTLGRREIFEISSISKTNLEMLLEKLVEAPSINEYNIGRALQAIALTYPDLVVDFLIRRVQVAASKNEIAFVAIPKSWERQQPLDLRDAANYQEYLRRIRDLAVDPALTEHWGVTQAIRDLFEMIAMQFDEPVLQVLQEWVSLGNAEQVIQVSRLLAGAPPDFVFRERAFIEVLLNRANQLTSETYRSVKSALLSLMSLRTRSGVVGQPFPQDIEQRDRAHEVADELPAGSPSRRFYEELENSAIESIRRAEILDGTFE